MLVVRKKIKTSISFLLALALVSVAMAQSKIELASPLDLIIPLPYEVLTNVKRDIRLAPRIYQVDKLPMFCKIEHRLGASAQYNIKMRLGDVNYVDKLEGKGINRLPDINIP